jgi:hypothetical protein
VNRDFWAQNPVQALKTGEKRWKSIFRGLEFFFKKNRFWLCFKKIFLKVVAQKIVLLIWKEL